MGFLAGETILAAKLDRIQPVDYEMACTTLTTLTTSEADITGATVTVTTTAANAKYRVAAVFDFEATTAGAAIMQGRLSVAGVTQSREAHLDGAYSADARVTPAQVWTGTLGAAGSHIFKLRGLKSAAAGVMVANSVHTAATVTIMEVP